MRWAMMLRWISELPPAIVFANVMKNPCDQAARLVAELGVGDRAERPADLHAELEHGLAGLRRRHLHVGVLGRRRALRERREALVAERAQARRQLVGLPRSCGGRPGRGRGPCRWASSTSPARSARAGATLSTQRPGALVRERALRDRPAAVELADEVLARHDHVGEEHLGEPGLAVDVAQRPDVDARRVHVDDEQRDALVLRQRRVGAHVAEALAGRSSRSSSRPSGR